MKKWRVSDIRWASTSDLELPFWYKWNRQNPLPDGFWQRIWEYPYVASKIPKSEKSLDIGGTYPFILFNNFPHAISVDCRDLNKLEHPYHHGRWPKEKLLICDAAKIPVANNSFNYTFSISSIEEMPHTFEVLKEMIRITQYRVVVTMDVSDILGIPVKKLRELEEFLNIKIPNLPNDSLTSISSVLNTFKQSKRKEYKHIRVLAFTIDAVDEPKSVAILIPHWNSLPFLKLCIEHIQNYHNKTLNEKIYILDDASDDGSFKKAQNFFKNYKNIEFYRFERYNKKREADVGQLLDYGLRFVKEQYVVTIDADLFPISKDWLAFPIWLIEKYNCSSVGLDTGLSNAYLKKIRLQKWWNPDEGYLPCGGIYDNSWFTCTNNLYRVMNTALAKVVSENIGFTRATSKNNIFRAMLNRINKFLPFHYFDTHLFNKRFPYLPGGEDNGVAANHFIDINKMGPKFNIPLTSYIGLTPKDGAFGQNISGLVFHFALSTRALSADRREVQNAGKSYNDWVKKLQNAKAIDDNVLKRMIEESKHFQPGGYDGSISASWYKNEYLFIQKLLKEYKKSNF